MALLEILLDWDTAARAWLTGHHHPAIDILMVGLSIIGRGGSVWLMLTLGLFLQDRRRGRAAARVVLALAMSYAVTDGIVKPLVARARPFEPPSVTRVIDSRPDTYSFPSGHAAASVAGAMTLSQVWPRGRAVLWVLALLVSFSRIYVGVHYPFDSVVGLAIGLACALAIQGALRVGQRLVVQLHRRGTAGRDRWAAEPQSTRPAVNDASSDA